MPRRTDQRRPARPVGGAWGRGARRAAAVEPLRRRREGQRHARSGAPLIALEVERIRIAMPTARDMVMAGLFWYAGLRPEKALALRWSDVRPGLLVVDRAWTHGELKSTKTYQRRTIEIMGPLAADLEMLRPGDPGRDDLACPNRSGGVLDVNN